jgi:hypothetical protein
VRTPHRDRVFAFRDFILATFPLGGALLQGGHSAGDASGAGAGTGTGIGMGSGGGGGGGGGGGDGGGMGEGAGEGGGEGGGWVLDVAGGKGDLSWLLTNAAPRLRSVIVDPRATVLRPLATTNRH